MTFKALFLVECGATQGVGHLRRSLALAAAQSKLGATCKFLLTGPEHIDRVAEFGHRAEVWNPADLDVAKGFDAVVLDGYRYDLALPANWRDQLVRCAIDDTAERPQELEIVVNHNLYGSHCDYTAYAVDRVLAGPEFALVLPAFCRLRGRARPPEGGILVSFGGTDDGRYAVPLVRALRDAGISAPIHVAFTSDAPEALAPLGSMRVEIHVGRPLEEIMAHVTLYVGAAGVTVLEAFAAGLSVVVCSIAANHHLNVAMLSRLGIPAFATFDRTGMAGSAAAVLNGSVSYVRELVDGRGAERVARAIAEAVAQRSAGTR